MPDGKYTLRESPGLWWQVPEALLFIPPPFKCFLIECDECLAERAVGLLAMDSYPESPALARALGYAEGELVHSLSCSVRRG